MKHTQPNGRAFDTIVDASVDASVAGTRDAAITDVNANICHWWQTRIIAGGANYLTFLGAHWIDLDSLTGATGDIGPHAGDPINGSVSSTNLAPNTSYLIHKNSDAHRGQKQGRLYWGPVAESEADNLGVLLTGIAAAVAAKFEAFRNDMDTFSSLNLDSVAWRTVHVHKVDKTDPSTWTWSSSTINTISCDPKVATQRRRLR